MVTKEVAYWLRDVGEVGRIGDKLGRGRKEGGRDASRRHQRA